MSPSQRSSRMLLCILTVVSTGCHQRPGPVSESSAAAWEAPGRRSAPPAAASRGSEATEDLKAGDVVTSRMEDLFAGRFVGLDVSRTFDGGISMLLRGREPLLLIDGMQADGVALAAVHPSSVLRIEVLRNLSETGIYGPRGINGVVVVTTRG